MTKTDSLAVRSVGLVVGLGGTAMSMSSGFVWASQSKIAIVYVAGFFSWTGYLFAHYAVVGVFVDDAGRDSTDEDGTDSASNGSKQVSDPVRTETSENGTDAGRSARQMITAIRDIAPADIPSAVGFVAGIVILVTASRSWHGTSVKKVICSGTSAAGCSLLATSSLTTSIRANLSSRIRSVDR